MVFPTYVHFGKNVTWYKIYDWLQLLITYLIIYIDFNPCNFQILIMLIPFKNANNDEDICS